MPSIDDASNGHDATGLGSARGIESRLKLPRLSLHVALLLGSLLLMLWLRFPRQPSSSQTPTCSQPFVAEPCADCTTSDLLTALRPCLGQTLLGKYQLLKLPRGLTLLYSPPPVIKMGLGNILSQYFQGLALATFAGK